MKKVSAIKYYLPLLFIFSYISLQAQYDQAYDSTGKKKTLHLNIPVRNGFVYTEPYHGFACLGAGLTVYTHRDKDSVVSLVPGRVVLKQPMDESRLAVIIKSAKHQILYVGIAEDCHLNIGDSVNSNQFLFNLVKRNNAISELTLIIDDNGKADLYSHESVEFIEKIVKTAPTAAKRR